MNNFDQIQFTANVIFWHCCYISALQRERELCDEDCRFSGLQEICDSRRRRDSLQSSGHVAGPVSIESTSGTFGWTLGEKYFNAISNVCKSSAVHVTQPILRLFLAYLYLPANGVILK